MLVQITGPDVLPFNCEKQNLLMHVVHDLHQGLGWGDQYFRFGRIQENAGRKAARIQIINNRVSVAAGLHEVNLPHAVWRHFFLFICIAVYASLQCRHTDACVQTCMML